MQTKRRTAFNISAATIQRLKIRMAELDIVNQSALVEQLIEKWLADKPNKERE